MKLATIAKTPAFATKHTDTTTRLVNCINASSALHQITGTLDLKNRTEKITSLVLSSTQPLHEDLTKSLNSLSEEAGDFFLVRNIAGDPVGTNRSFRDTEDVKIGVVLTTVPPESITIEEMKGSEIHRGLRTHNNYQVKTGRGFIRVRLKLVFPNADTINNELRHIIGQFRTMPLTTLQSRYIYDAVHGKLHGKPNEESRARLRTELQRIIKEEKNVIERIRTILTRAGLESSIPALNTVDAAQFAQQLRKNLRGEALTKDEPLAETLREAGGFLKAQPKGSDVSRLVDDFRTLTEQREQLAQRSVEDTLNAARMSRALPVLPMLFEELNLTTVPGFPDRLEAQLSLQLMNYLPYTDSFLFRNVLGGPTPLLERCPLYRNYYIRRMEGKKDLNIGRWPPEQDSYGGGFFLGAPIPFDNLESVRTVRRKTDNDDSTRAPGGAKGFKRPLQFSELFVPYETPSSGASAVQLYAQSFTVGVQHILSKTPTLSGQYPCFQSMGGPPARATLRIMARHDAIGDVHRIKKMVDQLALHTGGRAKRYNFVRFRDMPVMQVIGINEWQIDSMTTYPVDPDWSAIDVSLTSFRPEPIEKPKFLESQSARTTRGRLKHAWKEIFKLADKYKKDFDEIHKLIKGPVRRNEALVDLHQSKEFDAWLVAVGGGPLGFQTPYNPGVFRTTLASASVIEAMFANRPALLQKATAHVLTSRRALRDREKVFIRPRSRNRVVFHDRERTGLPTVLHTLDGAVIFDDPDLAARRSARARHLTVHGAADKAVGQVLPAVLEDLIAGRKSYVKELGELYPGSLDDALSIDRTKRGVQPVKSLRGDVAEQTLSDLGKHGFDALMPKTARGWSEVRLAVAKNRGEDAGFFDLFADDDYTMKEQLGYLADVVLGKIPRLETLSDHLRRDYEKDVDPRRIDQEDPYPDLNLPTYDEAYQSLLRQLQDVWNLAETVTGATSGVLATWLELLPDFMTKAIKAPTHATEGRSDIPEEVLNDLAVKADDTVDPDFWLYHDGLDGLFEEVDRELVQKEVRRLSSGLGTFAVQTKEDIRLVFKEGRENVKEDNEPLNAPTRDELWAPRKHTFDPKKGNVSLSPFRERHSSSIEWASGVPDTGVRSEDVVQDLLERSVRNQRDMRNRMSRFFPTYQLYFIHEERGLLTRFADWYGYNAIISMHITRHKWQPDVAELALANPAGSLDHLRFRPRTAEERLDAEHAQTESGRREGEIPDTVLTRDKERITDKLLLSEGTRVVIKMGFSGRPTALDTVFTGKIAELNTGDIVRLVCQGYAGELAFPLQEKATVDLETILGNIAKRVGLVEPRPHRILSLVHAVLEQLPTENFGRWGLAEILSSNPEALLEQGRDVNVLTKMEGRVGELFKALFYDPKLENIGGVTRGVLIGESPFDKEAQILQGKDEWVLNPDQTGLQILREVMLMYPGHIFCVRPYDDRATLVFGRPEGRYVHTRTGQEERIAAQLKVKSRASPTDEDGPVSGVLEFLRRFFRSGSRRSNSLLEYVSLDQQVKLGATRLTTPFKYEESIERLSIGSGSAALAFGRRRDVALKAIYDSISEFDVVRAQRLFDDYTDFFGSTEKAHQFLTVALGFLSERDAFVRESGGGELVITVIGGAKAGIFGRQQSQRTARPILVPNIKALAFSESRVKQITESISLAIGVPPSILRRVWEEGSSDVGHPATIFLARHVTVVRRYLLLLLEFLREEGQTFEGLAPLFEAKRERDQLFEVGTKPIRSHHFVDSIHDIIANNIVATRGVMKNVIRIFGGNEAAAAAASGDIGDSNWKVVAVDDDIKLGSQIIGHSYSPNATDAVHLYLAGYGHLAENLRPMYRGELIIRGRPEIQPYDIVFIYDIYNKIWGPIEVERVTHHFSYETGFTTTIIPHLYCTATNDVDWISTTGASMRWGVLGLAIVAGAAVALPVSLFVAGLTASALALATAGLAAGGVANWATSKVYQNVTGSTVLGTLVGKGFMGRKENPIAMSPLIKNGEPFVAAMEGFEAGNWTRGKLIEKKWNWLKEGATKTWSDVTTGFEAFAGNVLGRYF